MTNFVIVIIFSNMIKKYTLVIAQICNQRISRGCRLVQKLQFCVSIVILLAISACSALSSAEKKAQYPQQPEDIKRNRAGSLLGDGGFKIFNGEKKSETVESEGTKPVLAVNGYLWRASLDTVSFMPLASADPIGGVIITDWYEDPEAKGERFKVNLVILDTNLRSNSVKVSAFKQIFKSGSWRDAAVSEKVARDLENKILTRARQLRLEKESK